MPSTSSPRSLSVTPPVHAAVTGATGLIGRTLVARLRSPAVLTRSPTRASSALAGVEAHRWDPEVEPAPPAAFEGVEAVFHLAGEPVGSGRWTAERRQRIRSSRVMGTRNLVAGLAALRVRPRVLVSASAIGYYGDRHDDVLDEKSSPGRGFLAEVCTEWEREAMAATELGLRVVRVRFGIVLDAGGGALGQMLPVFRLGLGGPLGGGRQWMSWVHVDDVVGLLLHAAQEQRVEGPMNVVAPGPVTNAEFTRTLAKALRRPALLPVPSLGLRAVFGEMAEVLTGSQRVVPRVALASGYHFRHDELSAALSDLLGGAG